MIDRRRAGILAALVLAGVGTLVLVNYVRDSGETAAPGEESAPVLIVRGEIARGTPVAEFGTRVSPTEVPVRLRAEDAVSSLEGLSGRVAAVDLIPGDQLRANRLITAEEAVGLLSEFHQVTIALDATRVVGGQVRSGDRVGVVASLEGDQGLRTHMILHKVLVTSVQTAANGAKVTTAAAGTSPVGSIQVTLALDAPSVERLVLSAESGALWLTLEPPGAPETGTVIVTPGSVLQP